MHLKPCLLSVLALALGDHGHRKRVSHLHFIPLQNQPVLRAPLVVRDVPVVGAVVVSGPSGPLRVTGGEISPDVHWVKAAAWVPVEKLYLLASSVELVYLNLRVKGYLNIERILVLMWKKCRVLLYRYTQLIPLFPRSCVVFYLGIECTYWMTSCVSIFSANERCISTLLKRHLKILWNRKNNSPFLWSIFSFHTVKHICESYAWCLSFTACPVWAGANVFVKKRGKKNPTNLMSPFLAACFKSACFNFPFDEDMVEKHVL